MSYNYRPLNAPVWVQIKRGIWEQFWVELEHLFPVKPSVRKLSLHPDLGTFPKFAASRGLEELMRTEQSNEVEREHQQAKTRPKRGAEKPRKGSPRRGLGAWREGEREGVGKLTYEKCHL
jgi:hypothetical protein